MLDDKVIESHAQVILGKDFKFRPFQFEAVKYIVENAMSDVKHTMLEAPTGSGKSLTALIAAYVLWREFSKTSYILVSDDVLNKICQGIGRGVRHEHDWCKTYILDGCISWLVGKLDKMSVLHGRFKKM